MEALREEQVSSKVLDHLGLVASTIEKLGLVEKIDQRIPISKAKGAKVTIGQRVAAMILNGLGFIDDRLYMFPQFLKNKPVDRLFGADLCAEDFNDDALGRGLDEIYDYGVTRLFSDVSFEIGDENQLLGNNAHFDTSSLSVYGEYENQVQPEDKQSETVKQTGIEEAPKINHGYSKDHRPDLKQMVINLATTGSAAFPIWMESHSGNASDKNILHQAAQRMQDFCHGLKDVPEFMYVGDSAMYEKCTKQKGSLIWLSRVPSNIKAAKELLVRDKNDFAWIELDDGYRMCPIEICHQGVHQRWVIIFSKHAYLREIKTLEKNITQEYEQQTKALWHLSHQTYQCQEDANQALMELEKKFKYHCSVCEVKQVNKHKGRGRPKKGEQGKLLGYQVHAKLEQDAQKIKLHRNQKGRFILATNQIDREKLPDNQVLTEYKFQSKTESGFRFIKDDTFEVASIFLKKPERIAALMMIMTLCLMVYSFAQYDLRCALEKNDKTIPNQNGKPTKKPTMKWVYRLFHGVQVLRIRTKLFFQELVINLDDVLKTIIGYFGSHAMRIYSLELSG